MTKLTFTPLMLRIEGIDNFDEESIIESAADAAQNIFDTWLKENGQVMYGQYQDQNYWWWSHEANEKDTHKALLINVEEIPAAVECEHEGVWSDRDLEYRCVKCDIDLKPTGWEPA